MSFRRVKGDSNLATIRTALEALDGKEAKVGWFETAHYAGGQPVAYIASIHEFGYAAGGIPARPFMRPAVVEYGPSWIELLGQGAQAVLRGTHSAVQALEMVALRAAGDVAKSIQAVSSPPLSPATIARKGHAKPLVHTGQLIQSVTGKVE